MSFNDLRSILEGGTLFLLGPSVDGSIGMGTAFFIGANLLITNRHVVDELDPSRLWVTSKRLGRANQVELIGQTSAGRASDPDFALLRLKDATAPTVLSVAASSEKLEPVIAAGYPGLTLDTDAGFYGLLQGDISAAPDLNMNDGAIRSIQSIGAITRLIHTAELLKGYSGGPLIDFCGRVVGVNTFYHVDQEEMNKSNSAISSTELSAFLRQQGIALPLDMRTCSTG